MVVQTSPAVATPPSLVIEPTTSQQAPLLLAPVIEPVPLLQPAPPQAATAPLSSLASLPATAHTSLPQQPSASLMTPAEPPNVQAQPAVSPTGLLIPPQQGSGLASVGIAPPPSRSAAAPKAEPQPPVPSLVQNPSQNGSSSSLLAPKPAAVEPDSSAATSHQSPQEGLSPGSASAEAPPAVQQRQTSAPTNAAAEQPDMLPSPGVIISPISIAVLRQQAPMPSQSSEPSVRAPPALAAQLEQNGSESAPGQQQPVSQPNAADEALAPLSASASIGSSFGIASAAPALQTPAQAPSLAAGQLRPSPVPQPSVEQVPAENSPSVKRQLSPEGAALESSHAPADASSPMEIVAEVPVRTGVVTAPASSQVREIAQLLPAFKAVGVKCLTGSWLVASCRHPFFIPLEANCLLQSIADMRKSVASKEADCDIRCRSDCFAACEGDCRKL